MKHGGSGKKSEGPGKREEERNNKTMTKQCNVKEYTRHKAMSEEGMKGGRSKASTSTCRSRAHITFSSLTSHFYPISPKPPFEITKKVSLFWVEPNQLCAKMLNAEDLRSKHLNRYYKN